MREFLRDPRELVSPKRVQVIMRAYLGTVGDHLFHMREWEQHFRQEGYGSRDIRKFPKTGPRLQAARREAEDSIMLARHTDLFAEEYQRSGFEYSLEDDAWIDQREEQEEIET